MNPPQNLDDELFLLEQKIAQRADELSRQFGVDRGRALQHWRQAEREVLQYDTPELMADTLRR